MIALCVHWFNPIVWIMCILFNRDLEIACDERVISISGEGTKSDYALSLINLAQKKREFTPLYNGFGKNAIKERIECIMKFKKIPVLATVLSLILIIGAGSVFATPKVNDSDNASFSFKVDGVNEKNIVINDTDFKYAEKINLDSPDKNSFFDFKSDIASFENINTYNFEELKKLIENLQIETDKLVKKGELTQGKADEAVNFYKKQIAELEKNGGIKIKASTGKDATEELHRLDELAFVLPTNILAEVLKNTETLTFGIQIKEIGDWSDFSTSSRSFKK